MTGSAGPLNNYELTLLALVLLWGLFESSVAWLQERRMDKLEQELRKMMNLDHLKEVLFADEKKQEVPFIRHEPTIEKPKT